MFFGMNFFFFKRKDNFLSRLLNCDKDIWTAHKEKLKISWVFSLSKFLGVF